MGAAIRIEPAQWFFFVFHYVYYRPENRDFAIVLDGSTHHSAMFLVVLF